jgi:predicted dehydrogenase
MKPITTALLSYGMSGEVFHAPLLQAHPGFTLASVVQRSRQHAKERYPDVAIVKSVDDIIADEAIELIIVNTPNETHFEFASRALRAGKNIIVEKPFTVTSTEAEELIAISRETGRMLSVFQNRRWDGDFITVQQILAAKLVGKIAEFELHYDRYRNYIEANTWKEESGPGTGILYNLGSHMLDQVLVLFGMPLDVDARMGIQRPGGKVDDYYDIRLRYTDFSAIVKSSYLVREQGPRYALHGTDGSYVKHGIDPQEQALKEGNIPGTTSWGYEPRELWGKLNVSIGSLHVEGVVETAVGNYLAYYDNIFDVLRAGKSLSVTGEQGLDVIRLIEACAESNRLRKAIAIV